MPSQVTFLPSPFENEHMLGLIARWGYLVSDGDIALSLNRLSPKASMLTSKYVFHPMLDDVLNIYCDAIKRDLVVRQHTLVPYYCALMKYKSIYPLIHQIKYRGTFHNKMKRVKSTCTPTALYNSVLKFGNQWRWCGQCVSEDEENKGTPYWHSAHQIPSMLSCYRHSGSALTAGCNHCGFSIKDLRKQVLPPKNNQCLDCQEPFSPIYYERNEVIEWVERCSLKLQTQQGNLTSSEYSFIMKHQVPGRFADIVGKNVHQSIFIADKLQQEFTKWFEINGLGVFFEEPETAIYNDVLNLEKGIYKASNWPPLSVLLWLKFLDVEWPSVNIAA